MLDPRKDLKGVSPEILAKTNFKNSLLPRRVIKTVEYGTL